MQDESVEKRLGQNRGQYIYSSSAQQPNSCATGMPVHLDNAVRFVGINIVRHHGPITETAVMTTKVRQDRQFQISNVVRQLLCYGAKVTCQSVIAISNEMHWIYSPCCNQD